MKGGIAVGRSKSIDDFALLQLSVDRSDPGGPVDSPTAPATGSRSRRAAVLGGINRSDTWVAATTTTTFPAVSAVPLAAPPGVSASTCRMEDDGSLTARGGGGTSVSCLLAYGGSGGDAGSYVEVDYTAALYTKYAFDIRFSNGIVGDNNVLPHGGITPCNRDGLSTARKYTYPKSPEFWFIDRNSDFGYGAKGWEPQVPSDYTDPGYYGRALPVSNEEKHWEIVMRFDSNGYSLVSWWVEGVSFSKYSGNVTGCPLTGSDHAFVPRVWAFRGDNDVSIKNFQVFQGSNLSEMVQTLPPQASATTTTAGDGPSSVVGDPHCTNVVHERFDIRADGEHTLVRIPQLVNSSGTPDLRVDAVVQHLETGCEKAFVTSVSVSGRWTGGGLGLLRITRGSNTNDTLLVNEEEPAEFFKRLRFQGVEVGPLSLKFKIRDIGFHVGKHFEGRYGKQQSYLDVHIRGLKNYFEDVGGLLGHDSHEAAGNPSANCTPARAAAGSGGSSLIGEGRSAPSTDGGSRIVAE